MTFSALLIKMLPLQFQGACLAKAACAAAVSPLPAKFRRGSDLLNFRAILPLFLSAMRTFRLLRFSKIFQESQLQTVSKSPKKWMLAVVMLAGLSGCGGGSKEPTGDGVLSTKHIPSAEQTLVLLQKAAQLNAAELQAAASEAGVAVSQRAQWPKSSSAPVSSPVSAAASLATAANSKASLKAMAYASVPAYRFFNAQTGAHFYTISETERDKVRNTLPQFSYEGVSFAVSPVAAPGLSPVYRFFNTQTGVHFYSISEDEKNHLLQTLPQFHYEGIAYYASKTKIDGFTELGRFYVPAKGFHFYTASSKEATNIDVFLNPTYKWEGFAYYVIGEDYSFGKSMLDELNAVRVQGGFGAMAHNKALEASAGNHGTYMVANYHNGFYWDYQLMSTIDAASGQFMAHTETVGLPYFTGVTPINRAAAAGFTTNYAAEVVVTGDVNYQLGAYNGCAGDLLNTVFHRDGLLGYELREFGAEVVYTPYKTGYVCIIEPAIYPSMAVNPPAGWVAVYPLAEQRGLPTAFRNEAPDPLPSSPIKGSPVTLYVEPTHQLLVTSFELRNSAGALVPAKVLTKADFPDYLGTGVAHLVPLSALAPNTRYTANFVGTNNGEPFIRNWSFYTQ